MGQVPHTYLRTSSDAVIPTDIQDRMIAEADRATPDNPFMTHTIASSHFAPVSHTGQLATILINATQ